jgi:6-phosphogluconate dehydrogenase
MQIGVVGLGRMGANISRRLMNAGHTSVVWDANKGAIDALGKDGATTATGLSDLVGKLDGSPRAVWVMLPHGKITDDTIETLSTLLGKGDIIIDGGPRGGRGATRGQSRGISMLGQSEPGTSSK